MPAAVSEAVLLWSAALLVVALVVLPYLWRFRRRLRHDRERKEEAAALGIDKPAAQFPYVDPTHCIGCGACVRACPEGDVLGIVGGTAVVVNGLRCVGHARCEEACPVGAITVGLGDLKSRQDVPLLDDRHQTTVPGIYVVGELGGLALVRNAVLQGRKVVEHIAREVAPAAAAKADGEVIDLLVVGAGPSGLSAALTARAAGLSHVVLEREESLGGSLLHYPRRKMVLTQPVELPPWGALTREEYAKEDLLQVFEGIVEEHGLDVRFGQPVLDVRRENGHFAVRAGGGAFQARTVVLALGRRGTPRKLGVPGEELPKVMYRLLDAEGYRDQKILVVGGGDSAAEAAIGLARQPGNEVTLSYRREKLVRLKKKNQDALDALLASGRVRPLFSSQPVEITPDSVRLKVGAETVELANDYVFVFAGGVPPFDFLKKIGVRLGGETADEAKTAA
ncbi:MAG TPA: NAD(P)-binding domain-containing protein [Thermoanaerobaculia bacterium]|nr:NAD(P)-binding domain-containing protein [Thermoanaerobaculia bacterium]